MKLRLPCAMLLPLLALVATGPVAAQSPRLRILVPAYFYPAGVGLKEWDRLLKSPGLENTIIIANPDSGPGKTVDASYAKVLDRTHLTSATVIGYVSTSYAKRPLADVKADVDRWLRFYPTIHGIFYDEQSSAPAQLDYYRALYDYARTEKKLSLVVTNPGTVCDEGYVSRPCADSTCLFENPYKATSLNFPAWTAKYPAAGKTALPYKVSTSKAMKDVVQLAVSKKIGVLYVTDASGTNPWKRLPMYWEDEVAAVMDVNSRQ